MLSTRRVSRVVVVWTLGLLTVFATPWSRRLGAVLGQEAGISSDQEPLDQVLELLSHGAAIGNVIRGRPSMPRDHEAWDSAMENLRASSDVPVATAARAAQQVTAQRAAGREVQRLVDRKNAPLLEQAAAENLMGQLLWDLGERVSASDLDEQVRRGALSREQANRILELESNRRAQLERGQMAFFESLYNQELASHEIKRLRLQAEVLEGRIVAEHLAPALRARAGKDAAPEIDLFIGGKSSPSPRWPLEGFAYISVRSQADFELTRVTLLVKLNLPLGTRFACAYIPRLPPRGQFRLAPVNYAVLFAKDPATGGEAAAPKSMARYSLWCDQFAVEDREPVPRRSGRLEYAVQAVIPGAVYVDRSQLPSSRVAVKPTAVRFTELTPTGDGYEISAEVTVPDPKNPGQAISESFSGVVQAVKDQPKNAAALISLRSKSATHDLAAYIHEEGEVVLAGLGARSPLSSLVPQVEAEQAQAKKREFGSLNSQLVEARKLVMNGQRDEAEKRLNEFLASSPGEKWEAEAREILEKMDWLEGQGQRLKQAQEARKSTSGDPASRPKLGTLPKTRFENPKGNPKTTKRKSM
jgi:hypothetical protein